MPFKKDREYRLMTLPFSSVSEQKKFDTDYYVEGYATIFDKPYELWEEEGVKYMEVIDRHALDNADMSDVIMQYDHRGKVFARNKMGRGKPQTLLVQPDDVGFFIAADLQLTEDSRKMHEDIDKGLIYEMSWAFIVSDDDYDRQTHTRTIKKVKKVFDVSAVSIPASPDTVISARSWLDGVIEAEKQELLEQLELKKKKIKLKGLKTWN